MGMRVTIEATGESDPEASQATAKVEFYDTEDFCTAERLGQLIGYAINAIDAFIVPGSVVEGILETMHRGLTGGRMPNATQEDESESF